MGVAGLLLAPILPAACWLQEPTGGAPGGLATVFSLLARKPAFWLLAFAASCSSLTGYGLALWTPSVLMRSYGLDLRSTGTFLLRDPHRGQCGRARRGMARRPPRGHRSRLDARLPAIAWLITAPAFAIGLLAPSLWLAWPLLLVANAANILWLGPIVTAVQHLAPQPMRRRPRREIPWSSQNLL